MLLAKIFKLYRFPAQFGRFTKLGAKKQSVAAPLLATATATALAGPGPWPGPLAACLESIGATAWPCRSGPMPCTSIKPQLARPSQSRSQVWPGVGVRELVFVETRGHAGRGRVMSKLSQKDTPSRMGITTELVHKGRELKFNMIFDV